MPKQGTDLQLIKQVIKKLESGRIQVLEQCSGKQREKNVIACIEVIIELYTEQTGKRNGSNIIRKKKQTEYVSDSYE